MLKVRILALLVALTILFAVSVASFASPNQTNSSKELSKGEFKHQIDTLEKALKRADDGTLSLTISSSIQNELGLSNEDVHNFQTALENMNKRIKNGELATTKNFTIYKKNDTSFAIQGGIDTDINMWWGVRHYWCTDCANYKGYMSQQASYVAGFAAFLTAEVVPLAAINAVSCLWCGIYGTNLLYVNSQTTRGVISDIQYTLYFSNYPQ